MRAVRQSRTTMTDNLYGQELIRIRMPIADFLTCLYIILRLCFLFSKKKNRQGQSKNIKVCFVRELNFNCFTLKCLSGTESQLIPLQTPLCGMSQLTDTSTTCRPRLPYKYRLPWRDHSWHARKNLSASSLQLPSLVRTCFEIKYICLSY